MADNIQVNDNILVELDYQNICLIDPNKVVNIDGTVRERQIHHEDLVMYANLEAKMLPRTKLAVGANLLDAVQTTPIASINFLRPGGKTNLTNDYLDEITGLNSISGKGTNQPSKDNIQQQNKTNDFYVKQNTLNREDTGLLGIESIRVRNCLGLLNVITYKPTLLVSNVFALLLVVSDFGFSSLFFKSSKNFPTNPLDSISK